MSEITLGELEAEAEADVGGDGGDGGDDRVTTEIIDVLELQALKALVKLASEGNASAATGALTAIQRIREKGAPGLHAEKLAELGTDPVGMCAYLGWLGLGLKEASVRPGFEAGRGAGVGQGAR